MLTAAAPRAELGPARSPRGPGAEAEPPVPESDQDQLALAELARPGAALADVMAALKVLDGSTAPWRTLKAGIVANVTVDLLGTQLRRQAYGCGVRLAVARSSYDDFVGDVQAHQAAGAELLLLLPFFDNLQPAFEAQLDTMDDATRDAAIADALARVALALQAAAGVPQVLLFAGHLHQADVPLHSPRRAALQAWNDGLATLAARHPQVRLVATDGLLARLGSRAAFDTRFWFRAKAPYSAAAIAELAQAALQATRGFGSRFHKVLVLDCDHTLWGGIVGEDGLDGLRLSPHSHPGNIFWQVQQQLRALEAQGVLLALCSKNNDADVLEVLQHHPDMPLREQHLVARRVNWQDKPANLRALAAELNLGLDSFVFIDDSAFEVQAVREQLPQVTVFQVPAALHEYPALLAEQVAPLFVAGGVSEASRSKTQQYRGLAAAAQEQATFASHDDYLRSLQLQVSLQRNATAQVPRISELIAKSNQFNLSTQRLAAGEVAALMARPGADVWSFGVRDRLADHGLTGVIVTEDAGDTLVVHNFLMSCRVLGRGVERAVWRPLLAQAQARGLTAVRAVYRPTAKNAQVRDFYDRLGLPLTDEAADGSRHYAAPLAALRLADNDWVSVSEQHDDRS